MARPPLVDATLVQVGPYLATRRFPSARTFAQQFRLIELGPVADHVPRALHAADVLAQPSLADGFGYPVLEAMAMGSRLSPATTTPCPRSPTLPVLSLPSRPAISPAHLPMPAVASCPNLASTIPCTSRAGNRRPPSLPDRTAAPCSLPTRRWRIGRPRYDAVVGIAAGSLLTLAFRFGSTFLWTAIGVLTARTLTVEERGAYASVVVFTSAIGGIASLGAAAGYFVANRRRAPAEVGGNALLLSGAAASLALIGGLAVWLLLPGEPGRLGLMAGLLLPPNIIRNTLNGIVLGEGRVARHNLIGNLPVVIGFAFLSAVLLGSGERTALAALGAWTVAQYLSLLPFALGSPRWWTWLLRHRPDPALLRGLLRFTLVSGLAGVVGLLNYRIDLLLVVTLDSREGAGVYVSAIAGAEALWLFSSSIAMASFARVGAESRLEAARITALGVRHTLLMVTCGAAVLVVVAPWAAVALFGPDYEPAALPLRILCIGTLLYAPQSLLNNYFANQLGRPGIALALGLLALAMSVAVGALLIPTFGYVGAAWATTASYLTSGAAAIALFLWLAPVPARDLWRIRRADLERYPALARDLFLRVRRGGA